MLKNEGCIYIFYFLIFINFFEYGKNLKNNIDSLFEDVILDVIDIKVVILF